jgi:hypothetical protein
MLYFIKKIFEHNFVQNRLYKVNNFTLIALKVTLKCIIFIYQIIRLYQICFLLICRHVALRRVSLMPDMAGHLVRQQLFTAYWTTR